MRRDDEVDVPRIESLSVRNYRALRDLRLEGMAPLTVLLGPNASGKSTVFDVFAFLAECFSSGMRQAWEGRGRLKEIRSRGAQGPVEIELSYRESPTAPLMIYHLAIDEENREPLVAEEWLESRQDDRLAGRRLLDFRRGVGSVADESALPGRAGGEPEQLDSPDMLAVNTLGQLARYPHLRALRHFITGWYISYLSSQSGRALPEAGHQERLSPTGDNLPNVIQYLKEQHPQRLEQILHALSERIPYLERVDAELTQDGRLLLQIKDAPFAQPILARFASTGALRMLAYLTVLLDPQPPSLIGLEEPETHLHPRLLPLLVEECRLAAARTQLLVTTHSPFFVNGLKPEETWVLYRNGQGHTRARCVADMPGIQQFMEEGTQLGALWMEGHFDVGDPLTNTGGPRAGFESARRGNEE